MTRKKYLFLILMVLILGLSFAGAALAADPVSSVAGKRIAGFAKSLGGAALGAEGWIVAIWTALWVLSGILGYLLGFVSFALNNVFAWNVDWIPSIVTIAADGWTVVRDIANGLFILIVLWIALTIIFNLEQYGGKKLLVRVIIIAILINFSMVMVSSVFAFANALARPFYNIIGTTDIGGFIIGKTQLHTVLGAIEDEERSAIESQSEKRVESLGGPGRGQNPQQIFQAPVKSHNAFASLFRSLAPISEAQANPLAIVGLGFLTADIIKEIVKSLALTGLAVGTIVVGWKAILNLAISNLFLGLTIIAMGLAAITLFARIIAMVFLTALAPAAFLLHIVPFAGAKRWWDSWLKSLFKWAFYAPAFYFLFYLSLLFLQRFNESGLVQPASQLAANIPAVFVLSMFLAFLFASVLIGRYMGITVAETTLSWGKRLAAPLALGAGALAARAAVAVQARPEVQQRMQRLAEIPGLRFLGGAVPMRAAARLVEEQRKKVEEEGKKVSQYNKDMTLSDLSAPTLAMLPERRIALLERAAKEGWMKEAIDRFGESSVRGWVETAAQYGKQKEIIRTAPQLLTQNNFKTLVPGTDTLEGARKKVIEGIKTQELPDLPAYVLDNNDISDILLKSVSPEHWRQVMRSKNQELAQKMQQKLAERIQANPNLSRDMRADTYRFLISNTAGIRLPEGATPPVEVAREEAGAILEEERKTAERELSRIENEIRRRSAELEALRRRVRGLESQIATPGLTPTDRARGEGQINNLNTQISDLERRIGQLEQELQQRQQRGNV